MKPKSSLKFYKKRFVLLGIFAPPTGFITWWPTKNQILILKWHRDISNCNRDICILNIDTRISYRDICIKEQIEISLFEMQTYPFKLQISLFSYLNLVLFSSPEPKAHRWAYSIGRHLSSVVRRRSLSANIFKRHLLWSHEADSYQISHIASIGRGNE